MAEEKLTAADYAAADEVLEKHPQLLVGKSREELRASLAYGHSQLSDSQFRLKFGLRKAKSKSDFIRVRFYLGEITFEQLRDEIRADANRPVDEEMLNEYFEALIERILIYSSILDACWQAQRHYREEAFYDEKEIPADIAKIRAKYELDNIQIRTLLLFVDEVRAEKEMGLAKSRNYEASSAIQLCNDAFKALEHGWANCEQAAADPRSGHDCSSPGCLFMEHLVPDLPESASLLAQARQEWAVSKVVLRAREGSSKEPPTQVFRIDKASVTVENASEVGITKQPTEKAEAAPICSVQLWSELSIGIDEQRRYWAFIGEMYDGSPFVKSSSTEIRLAGERWDVLLDLLSKSIDGRRCGINELAIGLNYAPPPSNWPTASMTRRESMNQPEAFGLVLGGKSLHTQLQGLASDLTRELKQQVCGPGGRGKSPLSVGDKWFVARFQVRALIRDVNRLYFGQPPR